MALMTVIVTISFYNTKIIIEKKSANNLYIRRLVNANNFFIII